MTKKYLSRLKLCKKYWTGNLLLVLVFNFSVFFNIFILCVSLLSFKGLLVSQTRHFYICSMERVKQLSSSNPTLGKFCKQQVYSWLILLSEIELLTPGWFSNTLNCLKGQTFYYVNMFFCFDNRFALLLELLLLFCKNTVINSELL